MSLNHTVLAAAALAACLSAAAQTAPPARQPENLLAEAAKGVGIKRCGNAVARLSGLAIAGTRAHDVLLDWDRAKPDEGPFFSLLGLSYGTQAAAAATIAVVPQADGTCTVSAERISVAPYTCQSIAQVELKGYRVTTLLPNFNVYTQPGDPGASVSLIDSPPSCLVIRRHVQYGWKDPGPAGPASPASTPTPVR